MGQRGAILIVALLAGCVTAATPAQVDVSLNSTEPSVGSGPVAIWVFLPEAVRGCPSGVAVGMLAFGGDDIFGSDIYDRVGDVLSATTFLLTRFSGEGPESSAQFFPPNGTTSVVGYAERGQVADPAIYTVGNATWHERVEGGWQRMPTASATLHAQCAVEGAGEGQ